MKDSPIKIERERRGLTQKQLAEKLDTTEMTVSRWERGESVPRKGKLKAIQRKLGVDPEAVIKYAMGAA